MKVLTSHMRAFAADRRGALIPFTLVIFMVMLAAVGMGADLMRQEAQRAALQGALDRGILAAAASGKTALADLEAIVRDYAKSANLIATTHISVRRGTENSPPRLVAEGRSEIRTYFLRGIGKTTLPVIALSAAAKAAPVIEVALVLDVSGSMAHNKIAPTRAALTQVRAYPFQDKLSWNQDPYSITRLDFLRVAATRFVDSLLGLGAPGSVAITLVPYSGQANPGRTVFSHMTRSRAHEFSSCIEFTATDYTTLALPRAGRRGQVDHFQWFTYFGSMGPASDQVRWGWCPDDKVSMVSYSTDRTQLRTALSNLYGFDGTGPQNGIKWGLGMLDPSARPLINALVRTGEVDAAFTNRPEGYESGRAIKIVVLMTDGNATYQIRPAFPSRYWSRYSLGEAENFNVGRDYSQLHFSRTQARAQLQSLCDAARAKGIVIFTIGFDIRPGSHADQDMSACASGPAFYQDAQGASLDAAFQNVAGAITRLRLVQ